MTRLLKKRSLPGRGPLAGQEGRPGRLRLLLGGLPLGSGGGLGARLAALVPVVLALEFLHPAGGVHVLHLAGEEGVAGRADLDGYVLLGAARDELVAATARHG